MSSSNQTPSPSVIRKQILELVPSPDVLVPDLLTSRLPPLIKETTIDPAAAVSCISLNSPGVELDALLDLPMPPRKWVNELRDALVDLASQEEYKSIKHPTGQDVYLPLSAVDLWESLAVAVEQREAWSVAMQSLERWRSVPGAATALKMIGTIQWGRSVSGLRGSDARSRIGLLAGFLSLQWLSERHLDLLGLCLNAPPDVVVEVSLATVVKALEGRSTEQVLAVPELAQLQRQVEAGQCDRIFFPSNINNIHWVAYCVNTRTRTISYGA